MSDVLAPLKVPTLMKVFEPFDALDFQAATGVSDRALADLDAFRGLLADWNGRMNLVGPSAMAEFWRRHAYDSAQLVALEPSALVWADLGAGAGFPGVILAILLKGRAGAKVHLVESMAKRCRFLSHIVETLQLPATVHNARAESLNLKVDVVTARACAPLARLLGYAHPYLKLGARALFLKGQDVDIELQEASISWKFEAELTQSLSHAQGRIVQLKRAVRVKPT
jgi:16S rRNA (guanine527-N7)-methyltransferase